MSDTMNYTLKDLLDIPKFQALLDALDEIHSLPSAIIDAEGNILTATAWQDICVKFHRTNPEAAKKCVESDSYIAKELDKHTSHVVYKCPFGLVDTATPIIVEGRHLGNVFTGQLFTEPPDEERFIRQAREYGFAEKDYIEALRKVPMISEERLRKNLKFLGRFAEMLAMQGLVHLRQLQTDAVLRKKEAFLNTVIETMPIGVWLADNSGKLIKGNAAGQKIWEGSRYVGKEQYNEYKGWWADTGERIKPEEWSLARAISKGEISLDEVIDIECFDGSRKTILNSAVPIKDGDQKIAGAVVINQDITERKLAEEMQRNEQVRLRTILDTVKEPIFVKDNDHRLILVNRAFCDLFSLDESAVIGNTLAEQVSADETAHFLKVDRQVLDTGIPDVREETLTMKGLTRTIVTSKTSFADKSGKRFLVGSIHDITDRKKAEHALQTTKEYAEQLIQTANAIVIGLDSTGNIMVFNQAAEAITGYSKAEMSGRNWFEVIVPKDRYPHVWAEFDRLTTGGIPKNFENPILTKDGKERYIVWQNNELFEHGTVVGTISFGIDITERKWAEEAARDREYWMRESQQVAHIGSYVLDITTGMWTSSEILDEIFAIGKDYERSVGGWSALIHPDDRERMAQHFTDIVANKRRFEAEYRIIQKNSSKERWVSGLGELFLDRQGVPVKMVGTIQDITERKRTEAALQENAKQFRALAEQSLTGIALIQEGKFAYVNPCLAQIVGYSTEEMIGRSPEEFIVDEDRELVREKLRQRSSGELDKVNYTFRAKHKSGKEVIMEVFGSATIYQGKRAILSTLLDITEKKKLEEQLHQAQKMEAIGQLAGGVAHDFNNILSTITGYASLLEMAITSDATLREYASEISVASERGANLTQSLLAFSRKQEPSLSAVDLNAHIRNSHKILSRLVGEDIDLVLDLDREDLVAEADAGQLQQVLMNLAANARDAMPNGGTLRIETRTETVGSDRLERYALEHPGTYAVMSVADTGAGMERSVRERIFEPFYTTKGVGRGTGLGLSIVYGIVKKHGGSITVDSEPGKGTSFSIYLPLSERSVRGHGASESLPFAAPGDHTILVVEDEEPVRRVLKLTLEAYGYRVIEAVDGEDAVRVFRKHKDKVQLVLCDLIMPKKNGKVACDEMRAIRPDIKTIFMSGYTKDIFDQKGISETDITLLVKPINPKDLLIKIREVLEEKPRPT